MNLNQGIALSEHQTICSLFLHTDLMLSHDVIYHAIFSAWVRSHAFTRTQCQKKNISPKHLICLLLPKNTGDRPIIGLSLCRCARQHIQICSFIRAVLIFMPNFIISLISPQAWFPFSLSFLFLLGIYYLFKFLQIKFEKSH